MAKRLLLTEGEDDLHVVQNLCLARGIVLPVKDDTEYRSVAAEGLPDLLTLARNLILNEADLAFLAIVADADDDPLAVWRHLSTVLTKTGFTNLPATLDPNGTILSRDDGFKVISVGVWLMPDNIGSGMLESFLQQMISDAHTLVQSVDRFLETIPYPFRRYPNAKARVRGYLSVQEFPGLPPGKAISANYFDASVATVDPFLAWIRRSLGV